jgi:molybdopterin-guanine dinucleotide biosynthesis protein A
MRTRRQPIGVILAGGRGRRMGGTKAMVSLNGQPLISYPLGVVQGVLSDVAILAKSETELPGIAGVTVWIESDPIHHPLVGIIQAIELAEGRAVLVCAADFPFVTAELVTQLARADPGPAPAVIAAHEGETQPLLGCYQPTAAAFLRRADVDLPLRQAIAAIGPRLLEVADADVLFNVNTPDDLLQAAAMLDSRPISRK